MCAHERDTSALNVQCPLSTVYTVVIVHLTVKKRSVITDHFVMRLPEAPGRKLIPKPVVIEIERRCNVRWSPLIRFLCTY